MASSLSTKIKIQKQQKMFELLYKAEHICYCIHINGNSVLGFIYSGKWPDWGSFAEFFKSRGLRIPKSGNPHLAVRELSGNERRIVTTYIPEAKPRTEQPSPAALTPPAEQLDLLHFTAPPKSSPLLHETAYDERWN
jgi:hypothetical protein